MAEIHQFNHRAMATHFQVRIANEERTYAAQAAQAALGLLDTLESQLSRFRANSDIAQIGHKLFFLVFVKGRRRAIEKRLSNGPRLTAPRLQRFHCRGRQCGISVPIAETFDHRVQSLNRLTARGLVLQRS